MSCLTRDEIERLIREDAPYGDLTTHSLGIAGRAVETTFTARVDMQVSGIEEALAIFEVLGARGECQVSSGTHVPAGTGLLRVHGSARALFIGWKVAQTLVEWSSGVSTAVAAILAAARSASPEVMVACTRKTIPFSRSLSVKAVRSGGGVMHRLGLSDSILLFPEHSRFADGTLPQQLTRLRRAAPERAIAAEVTTVADALAVAPHVDVLQLEKMTPAQVAEIARHLAESTARPPVLAAAGGIHAGNAQEYAAAGAGLLVTSWPYQAPPRDVQVSFHGHDTPAA